MKRQYALSILIGALVLILLSLSGCGMLNPKTQVSGIVKDKAGSPIVGAVVTFGAESVNTDAEGAFLFEEVLKGTYDITVVVENETIYSNTIVVGKEPVVLTIEYIPAVVSGTAKFMSGNPGAGMTVLLGSTEAVVGVDGGFNFPTITFGTYDLTIKDGDTIFYGPVSYTIDKETTILEPVTLVNQPRTLGKSYIYTDKQPSSTYPDTTVELTDGVTAPASYSNVGWVGVWDTKPIGVQFDFGVSNTITEVRTHHLAGQAGIKWPIKIAVLASDDGTTWSAPVELVISDVVPDTATVQWYTIANANLTGRYFKVLMSPVTSGTNVFVSEIEIYQ